MTYPEHVCLYSLTDCQDAIFFKRLQKGRNREVIGLDTWILSRSTELLYLRRCCHCLSSNPRKCTRFTMLASSMFFTSSKLLECVRWCQHWTAMHTDANRGKFSKALNFQKLKNNSKRSKQENLGLNSMKYRQNTSLFITSYS